MHYQSIVVAALLSAFATAAPASIVQSESDITAVTSPLVPRAGTVTCQPTSNKSKQKKFTVDIAYAQKQMDVAGFTPGKSGDPHKYGNGDKIKWNVAECDGGKAQLWEYPVFWVGSKGKNGQLEWAKDLKTSKQAMNTPIRVVYADNKGTPKYCGVMTHSEVTADFQGKKFFEKCT